MDRDDHSDFFVKSVRLLTCTRVSAQRSTRTADKDVGRKDISYAVGSMTSNKSKCTTQGEDNEIPRRTNDRFTAREVRILYEDAS